MEYGCECYCDDGDSCELYNSENRVARKEHKCCECGRTIRKGEQYEYANGKFEGDFFKNKTCLGCKRLRDDIGCNAHGVLAETVQECFGVHIGCKGGNDA